MCVVILVDLCFVMVGVHGHFSDHRPILQNQVQGGEIDEESKNDAKSFSRSACDPQPPGR